MDFILSNSWISKMLFKLLNILLKVPFLRRMINQIATNYICNKVTPRPRAFSLWSPKVNPLPDFTNSYNQQLKVGEFTSWPMLIDKDFSARHLKPATDKYVESLPEQKAFSETKKKFKDNEVTDLFIRYGDMDKGRSTMLFMFFAQWFTDSIMRVDPKDRRKTTSTHNIDLCQIYGLDEATATILRTKTDGKLKSQMINGEEYPDYIYDGNLKIKTEYKDLQYIKDKSFEGIFFDLAEDRKKRLYATGLERGNSTIGYVAISTIFLREHNRICAQLKIDNDGWCDEQLFQTARMINMVILIKLVVEDYINHIFGMKLFELNPGFADKQNWYRTPWIALEFDLLYRWHGLVPDHIEINGKPEPASVYRKNNILFEELGVGAVLTAASIQAAGTISLQNTPDFLMRAEYAMVRMGRDFKLQSYNQYREYFNLEKLERFSQLTTDKNLKSKLEKLYKHVDNVEFTVGLFAQEPGAGSIFGDLMGIMVAYDALTQIYTNPLLSANVYNEQTFTKYGMDLIANTKSAQDLVARNTTGKPKVSFTLKK